MLSKQEKDVRQIFVIMPFTKTPTRNEIQLTSFYEGNIKAPIEREDFIYRYQVRRSDKTFDITTQIIKDLYNADVVICDLSGTEGNPNVMYELGIRLSLTNKPVILIREKHEDNKQLFDIGGFFAQPYDPLNYSDLTKHIIHEIRDYEEKKKKGESPILKIVSGEIPLLQTISIQRADQLLATMRKSIKMMTWLFVKRFVRYLSVEQGVDVPSMEFDLSTLLSYMESNTEKFTKLDWTGFRVNFGTQPAIDHYLSNQYLNGLVDPRIEEIFTGFVITYHSYFVSTNYYSGQWNEMYVHRFLGETNIFLKCTKLLRIFLKLDDSKEKSEFKEFILGLLETSHIYSFPKPPETSLDSTQTNSATLG